MERRHENELNDMLDMVAFEGYATKPKWKIARWYGQAHFSVNVRRDLRDRWRVLVAEELGWNEVPMLKIAEVNGNIFLMKRTDFFPDKE